MPRPKKSNRADGRYEVKRTIGYTSDGAPVRKSFYGTNKLEAEEGYQLYLHEQERREAAKKRTDFASWVDEWLYTYKEPNVKPSTFNSTYETPCRRNIIPFFQDTILQDITNADIRRFANGLTGFSQSRIEKVLLCLRGIFDAAVDNDMIAKNPCKKISVKSKKKKEKKRTYDRETVDALCGSDHKYALYVHILLRMGLRCSELCGLRWSDIDLNAGTMTVRQALTVDRGRISIDAPKTENSTRRLKMPNDLIEILRAESAETEYVAMMNGRHVTPAHFSQYVLDHFYDHMHVPSDKRLTAHELRHTCGTLLYEDTKDIYHVSRFLGHSDIGITTKTYVHSEMQEEKIHIDFE